MKPQLIFALVLVTACAPTHVDTTSEYSGKEVLQRPDLVVVHPFAFTPEQVSPNSGVGHRLGNLVSGVSQSEDQIKVGRSAANALADELVKAINELGLPAQRAGEPVVVQRTVMIDGQFLTIDEGNRVRRMVIGFGVGGTEVRTKVQVYQGTSHTGALLQEFETKAESSKKPGMGPMVGVGAAATGAATTAAAVSGTVGTTTEFNQTVEGDARRTAREIAKKLSRFFAGKGWIPPEKAAK